MVFSCAAENSYDPMRFAGTWKQYSKKAIPQLTKITFHKASLRYFKCPYQANVMKTLETVNRRMVRTRVSHPYKFGCSASANRRPRPECTRFMDSHAFRDCNARFGTAPRSFLRPPIGSVMVARLASILDSFRRA